MASQLMMDKSLFWERRWASDSFSPKWAHRGVSPEIADAVNTGWFPAGAPVLDIGCGLGEVAAWFAKRGHATLGFDVAPTAIVRARELHSPLPPNLDLMVLDAIREPLPNRQFRILIDRGCLHTISPSFVAAYTRNVASVAAPGARMLLFIKAFRHGKPFGDPAETEMHVDIIRNAYAGRFNVVRHAPTNLNGGGGTQPRQHLPGLVFWLVASGGDKAV
jgi:SAM-dependent methyltransferase